MSSNSIPVAFANAMATAPRRKTVILDSNTTSSSSNMTSPHLLPHPSTIPTIPIPSIASTSTSTSSQPTSPIVSMSYSIEMQCNAFSMSPDRSALAVGGREVRIVQSPTGSPITSLSQLTSHSKTATPVTDIQWHPHDSHKQWIVAAPTNGKILLWNLLRDGLKRADTIFEDHERTVNRLCWHPQESTILFSGSQDGHVKLWDTRVKKVAQWSFADVVSVRDVQVNPLNPWQFAAAYENGTIQVWDVKTRTRVRTINAHQGLILTLDWHPEDKDILASGAVDRTIKVWDISSASEPLHTIQTIASVGRCKWRPGRSYQIASCASLMDFDIRVWNVHKPYVPIATCGGHKDVVTGIIWKDQHGDELLSCSKDSTLQQHPLHDAYLPYEHLRTVAASWNAQGYLALVTDKIDRSPIIHLRNPPTAPFPTSFRFIDSSNNPLAHQQEYADNGVVKIISTSQTDGPTPGSILPSGLAVDDTNVAAGASQMAHISLSEEEALVHFAKNLKFSGKLSDVCQHNAHVSDIAHRAELAQIWRMIDLLYGLDDPHDIISTTTTSTTLPNGVMPLNMDDDEEETKIKPTPVEEKKHAPTSTSTSSTTHHTHHPHDDDAVLDMSQYLDIHMTISLPPSQHPLPHPSQRILSKHQVHYNSRMTHKPNTNKMLLECLPLIHHSHVLGSNDDHHHFTHSKAFRDSLIHSFLAFATEQGDVQTCVAIVTILRDRVTFDPEQTRQWFWAYIDLLQRHQLFSNAAEIIRLSDDKELRQMNQKSTTIAITCPHCRHASQHVGLVCKHCSKYITSCSICQQQVVGIYVWCQGCGHGGHMEHMQSWFAQYPFCPTGCLHKCTEMVSHPLLTRASSSNNPSTSAASVLPTTQLTMPSSVTMPMLMTLPVQT